MATEVVLPPEASSPPRTGHLSSPIQGEQHGHNHVEDKVHQGLHQDGLQTAVDGTIHGQKQRKPRLRPDHPSYSCMIREAILGLKQKAGSSQHAITKNVADLYKGKLSKTFNKHLSQQLKRMVSANKITKNKGKFRLTLSYRKYNLSKEEKIKKDKAAAATRASYVIRRQPVVTSRKRKRSYTKVVRRVRKKKLTRRWRRGHKKKKRKKKRKKIRRKKKTTRSRKRRRTVYRRRVVPKRKTRANTKKRVKRWKQSPAKRRKVTKTRAPKKGQATILGDGAGSDHGSHGGSHASLRSHGLTHGSHGGSHTGSHASHGLHGSRGIVQNHDLEAHAHDHEERHTHVPHHEAEILVKSTTSQGVSTDDLIETQTRKRRRAPLRKQGRKVQVRGKRTFSGRRNVKRKVMRYKRKQRKRRRNLPKPKSRKRKTSSSRTSSIYRKRIKNEESKQRFKGGLIQLGELSASEFALSEEASSAKSLKA